jgi:hypothetical protein
MATQAEIEAQLASVRQQMLEHKSTQFADRAVVARAIDELLQVEALLKQELRALTGRPKQSLGVASKGF